MFEIIVAVDENLGIGKNNKLPWKSSNDLKHFASTTARCVLIFGHNTWFNLDDVTQSKILKNRNVIVITRDTYNNNEIHTVISFNNALILAKQVYENKTVFVCGGTKVYIEALIHRDLNSIYVTFIKGVFDCDTYIPKLKEVINKLSSIPLANHDDCSILIYY